MCNSVPLIFLFIFGAHALYPFTTTVGAPVCKVPSCVTCNVAQVEYSQARSVPNVTHFIQGGTFWETEITGSLCCGDNCASRGNILTQGFGVCVDTGDFRRSWSCGLCLDARCSCRRLSLETIPNECVKCAANYSVTPAAQCSPCPPNYVGDGVTCRPVDLCTSGAHNCDKQATCTFAGPGRFTCSCQRGYTGNGVSCAEVDICALDNRACHPDATCIKTGPGLFKCACKQGFTGDGSVCLDVDECVAPTRACEATQFCENSRGSFACIPCHEQCSLGCVGAGPDECQECKGFSLNTSCVRACPLGTFADEARRVCRPCDKECLAECRGEGRQACTECAHVSFVSPTDNITLCLAECPVGFFASRALQGRVCVPCTSSRIGSFIGNNCTSEQDTEFKICPPGYKCSGGPSAEKCEAGSYQPEGNSSVCLPASPGNFAQSGLVQQRCGLGFVSGLGAARCEPCPVGRQANVLQSACEDVNECQLSSGNCTQDTICRNTVGGYACDTIVITQRTPAWAWVVFALGISCCLLACAWFAVWKHRRRKAALKLNVERPEDVALTALEEDEGLVGPGSTKAVPQWPEETNG